jgi:hypothetical protein
MRLIDDESQWRACMLAATRNETNIRKLRMLFATICMQCNPTNPDAATLWTEFRDRLIEDFVRQRRDSVEVAVCKALKVCV